MKAEQRIPLRSWIRPASASARCRGEIGAEQFGHRFLLRGGLHEVLSTGIGDQPVEGCFLQVEMVTVACRRSNDRTRAFSNSCTPAPILE